MKGIICILSAFTTFFIGAQPVIASAGKIDEETIVTCNDKQYGTHGEDNHWHQVENGKAKGNNLGTDWSCEENGAIKEVTLEKCIDGDTSQFILDGQSVTARFLAIDTPETKHPTKGVEPYGKEASDYTCKTLTNAKKIELEFDTSSTKTDKYNRYLAWIWADGELVQDNLIKQGLAKVAYLYGDYKYASRLEQSENVAKTQKVNIWSLDNPAETANQLDETLDVEQNKNLNETDRSAEFGANSNIAIIIIFVIMILWTIYKISRKKKNK